MLCCGFILTATAAPRKEGCESLVTSKVTTLSQAPPHHNIQLMCSSMLKPSCVGQHLGCQETQQQPGHLSQLRSPYSLFVSMNVEMQGCPQAQTESDEASAEYVPSSASCRFVPLICGWHVGCVAEGIKHVFISATLESSTRCNLASLT